MLLMNCGKLLVRRLLSGTMTAALLLCAFFAAPRAAAEKLNDALRISNNAGEIRPQLATWLNTKVQDLGGADDAARSTARNDLIEAVAGAPTSNPFLDEYARQL